MLAKVPTNRGAFVPVIAAAVHDPHVHPRLTAVGVLSIIDDDAAVAAIKPAAGDRDPYIRAIAVLALLRHGQSLPIDQVKETLDFDSGRYPFQVESSVAAFGVDRHLVEEALAPRADGAIFRLLLEYPPNMLQYDDQNLFPRLGESLRRHPEAAGVLLAAYDAHQPVRRNFAPDFARDVFRFAGPTMLPLLYEALQSRDRVVRSNAARACGAIGDAAAIPHLIRALDLESGLSRASIVWALGELKAREALPRLTAMYVDVHRDENHRGQAFWRAIWHPNSNRKWTISTTPSTPLARGTN